MNSATTFLWCLGGLLILAGCGTGSNEHGTIPVTGQVTYKGAPVAAANVVFQPKSQGQQAGFGLTDSDGKFQLQTFEHNDGALPGEYLVSVSKVEIPVPEFDEGHPKYVPPPPPKYLVPRKYSETRTSGLTATVSSDGKNDFQLELKD